MHKEYGEDVSYLQEIICRVADIKIQMRNGNETMTHLTPIGKLRDSYNARKGELIDLDLRIGATRRKSYR